MIKLLIFISLTLTAFPTLAGIGQSRSENALSKNIFGVNDRTTSPTTDNTLGASFIGKLIKPNGGYCTASLVGKDLILTNAHCIAKEGLFIDGTYTFKLGYNNGESVAVSGVKKVWYGTLSPKKNNWVNDWAIFKLDTELGVTHGYFGVEKNPNYNRPFSIAGYGIEFSSSYLTIQNSCNYRGRSRDRILHDCDISPGDSGSPIFRCSDQSCVIVALHSAEFIGDRGVNATLPEFERINANLAVYPSKFYNQLVNIKNGDESTSASH